MTKKNKGVKRFSLANFFIGAFILFFALFCLLPMILTLIVSFTDETTIMRNGYSFFPEKFSLQAYSLIFRGESIAYSMMIPPVTLAFCLVLARLYSTPRKNRSLHWLGSVKRKV